MKAIHKSQCIHLFPLLLLGAACALTGCQSPKPRPLAATFPSLAIRNNCYSLLHQLFDEQKDVSMLRFIKREDSHLKGFLKRVAAESKTNGRLLEQYAKSDPSINLEDIQLPPGEVATRAAIAASKKDAILSDTGDALELSMLLDQTEALNYAWHLASVASKNEPDPERAQVVAGVGQEMRSLYQEAIIMLSSNQKPLTGNHSAP